MKKVLSLIILCTIPIIAQPVFTVNDLPEIGYEATLKQDTTDEITVDLGDTGGPQTWDYSREIDGTERLFHVVDPDDTPGADSFPQASMAYLLYHMDMGIVTMDWYQYFNPTSSAMNMIGDLWNTDSGDFYHEFEDRDYNPLPMQMGNTWIDGFNTLDTADAEFGVTIEIENVNHNEIDAYGTIIVPEGTYETLRYITYDTTISIFSMFYTPVQFDTTATISYTWAAAEVGPVMIISSNNWETDPDFTDADGYIALVENNHGFVEENQLPITSPILIEVVNNQIRYQINNPGDIRVDIYDALGRSNEVLFLGNATTGIKSLDIPANLTKGVYFVRLTTVSGSASAKFIKFD